MYHSETLEGIGQSLAFARGKSGLQRAACLLTAGRSNPTESATENIPPVAIASGKEMDALRIEALTGKGEMAG